jgi:hypothetical protein
MVYCTALYSAGVLNLVAGNGLVVYCTPCLLSLADVPYLKLTLCCRGPDLSTVGVPAGAVLYLVLVCLSMVTADE